MLEEMQRSGAAAVEQLDIGGLALQLIGIAERIHQLAEFGQPGCAQGALGLQGVAHLGQVGAQFRVGIGQQAREHPQADRCMGWSGEQGHG